MNSNQTAQFLAKRKYEAEEFYQWGEFELQVRAYLSDDLPPDSLITSARCILIKNDQLLVVNGAEDNQYILPGGQRGAEETVLETLTRELLEEVGWTVKTPQLLGFTHFHHLKPKPEGYAYPYPDFFQVIFVAETDVAYPEKMLENEYIVGVTFQPVNQKLIRSLTESEQVFLAAITE